MKKVSFKGWKNCIELKSGDFKLIVTTDIGPRVIGGFLGDSDNIFCVKDETAGTSGAKDWQIYGGHRLWHSPETKERTYAPDNVKIKVKDTGDGGVCFMNQTEELTGITKEIRIYPLGDNRFRVEHSMRNDGVWDIEAAAWALSVMAPGGVAIIPQNPNFNSLLPNKFISVWSYTNMNDPRITWGEKFVLVRQDSKAKTPIKIGMNCEEGWLAYINKGIAFVKQFDHFIDGEYPDNGCSVEVYTCDFMLEAETLSPLYILAPGDEILHVEEWSATPTKTVEISSEKDIDSLLNPEKVPEKKAKKKAEKKSATAKKETVKKK